MVMGIMPLVQKVHPHRELKPHREHRECGYLVVVGTVWVQFPTWVTFLH